MNTLNSNTTMNQEYNLNVDCIREILKYLNLNDLINKKKLCKELKKDVEKEIESRYNDYREKFSKYLEKYDTIEKQYTIKKFGDKSQSKFFCKICYHIDFEEFDDLYFLLKCVDLSQLHKVVFWTFNKKKTKTLFHFVCEKGLILIVKYILENLDQEYHSTIINLGTSNGAFNNICERPIHSALKNNHINVVEYLLSNEKTDSLALNSQRKDILDYAIKKNILKIISHFVSNNLNTFYQRCCIYGNKKLLECFSNYFYRNLSSEQIEIGVSYAIKKDRINFVKKIVSLFDINLCKKLHIINKFKKYKQKPLYTAMKFESKNVLKYLVENNLYNDPLRQIMRYVDSLDYYLDQDIIEMIVDNNYKSELYPAEEDRYYYPAEEDGYYYRKNDKNYDDDFSLDI